MNKLKSKIDWMPFMIGYAMVMGVTAMGGLLFVLFDQCCEINLWGW